MKPYIWYEGRSDKEAKDGAYWERNMLALLLAHQLNGMNEDFFDGDRNKPLCGWYEHQGDGFEGWSRVISIGDGRITFHVPDNFDLGDLPQIEPNWDGHTTEEKWNYIMDVCGCAIEK